MMPAKFTTPFLLLFILQLVSFEGYSQKEIDTLVLYSSDKMHLSGKYAMLLEDKEGALDIDQVLQETYQQQFAPILTSIFSSPASRSVYWFKLTIDNQTDETLWLEVGDQMADGWMGFYMPDSTGAYTLFDWRTIDAFSLSSAVTKTYVPILNKKGATTYYLRSNNIFPRVHTFNIGTLNALYQDIRLSDIGALLFIGLVFGIFIYNLFLYFSSKDSIYLIYAIERVLLVAVLAFDTGYLVLEWLWYHYFEWHNLVHVAQTLFIIRYLGLNKLSPKLSHLLWLMTLLLLSSMPLSWLVDFTWLINVWQLGIVCYYLLVLVAGAYAWYKGNQNAKIYTIAWGFAIACICIFMLGLNGFIPFTGLVRNAMYIGFGVESLLLALALGNKVNSLKKEKEAALAENLSLMKNQQNELEQKVEERTQALKEQKDKIEKQANALVLSKHQLRENSEELALRNQQLQEEKKRAEDMLKNLKQAQEKLVQSEKMSSLGLLTAGIGHEINNPINYIALGSEELECFAKDIARLLELYIDIENAPSDAERLTKKEALVIAKQELGEPMDILKDVMEMASIINMGIAQILEIVKGLKHFARGDEEKPRRADIHEIIDATLIILKAKHQGRVVIDCNYDRKLKSIICFPGPLAQVFLNLIANAIDAISNEGFISISTRQDEQMVFVCVRDTGAGMNPELVNKIFDPFFTTKEVGKGTGLGLSIVYGIIQRHQGVIEVESKIGEGTAFNITLPKKMVFMDE